MLRMSNQVKIICQPTAWFYKRFIGLSCLFFGMSAWFFFDGLKTYPKKNWEYYSYQTFKKAGEIFQNRYRQQGDKFNESEWVAIVSSQKMEFPQQEKRLLPKTVSRDQPWPDELKNFDVLIENVSAKIPAQKLWIDYSRNLPFNTNNPIDHAYSQQQILQQIGIAFCLLAIAMGYCLFNLRIALGRLELDEVGIRTAFGKRVLFEQIEALDTKKWDKKGIATLTFSEGGKIRKVRLDGMIYGGFSETEEALAEKFLETLRLKLEEN